MSQGSAPCRGYVVELTDELIQKLGLDTLTEDVDVTCCLLGVPHRGDIRLEDANPRAALTVLAGEGESISIDLHALIGHGRTVEATPFLYDADQGDCYDELEDGKLYLIFNENDLYTKTETEEFKALSTLGITPEEKSWTNFG